MSRPLPQDERGYAVDRSTQLVHSRYADHAIGYPRTRTILGVMSMMRGRSFEPCDVCYPPPPPPRKRPTFATGGLVKGLAPLIVGESGPETVIRPRRTDPGDEAPEILPKPEAE